MTYHLLSDAILALESGRRPAGGVSDKGEVLSIGAEHLDGAGGFDLSSPKRISRAFYQSLTSGRIAPDDILVVKDGATTGKVAYVGQGSCVVGAAVNEHVFRIQVDPGLAEPRFVYHYLAGTQGQASILRDFRGATVGGISRGFAEKVQLPLPPLAEQRRIANLLDKADAIRRKRQQAIRLADDLIQSLYVAIVGPANSDHVHWPIRRIEQLADPAPGSMRTGPFGSALRHSEFVDEGIAVLGIDNAVKNRFAWAERRFITREKYSAMAQYTVKPGDVIITIMGTTGRSAVVPDDVPLAISTKHLVTITVDRTRVHPEFLSNAIHRDPQVRRQLQSRDRGAIMPGLNLGLIRSLELRLPPTIAQARFAAAINSTRGLEARGQSSCGQADDLFHSLAQRAFGLLHSTAQ